MRANPFFSAISSSSNLSGFSVKGGDGGQVTGTKDAISCFLCSSVYFLNEEVGRSLFLQKENLHFSPNAKQLTANISN